MPDSMARSSMERFFFNLRLLILLPTRIEISSFDLIGETKLYADVGINNGRYAIAQNWCV
jgi:hypothetical protein